jgi:hypothetical protein
MVKGYPGGAIASIACIVKEVIAGRTVTAVTLWMETACPPACHFNVLAAVDFTVRIFSFNPTCHAGPCCLKRIDE